MTPVRSIRDLDVQRVVSTGTGNQCVLSLWYDAWVMVIRETAAIGNQLSCYNNVTRQVRTFTI